MIASTSGEERTPVGLTVDEFSFYVVEYDPQLDWDGRVDSNMRCTDTE